MVKEKTTVYKSKKFAIRIVKLYKHLSENKNEYILSKQLLRSGTSIGANLAESECAMSKKDFLSKIYIAFKETNETLYWLELLFETEFLAKSEYESIKSDCEELKECFRHLQKLLYRNLVNNMNGYGRSPSETPPSSLLSPHLKSSGLRRFPVTARFHYKSLSRQHIECR